METVKGHSTSVFLSIGFFAILAGFCVLMYFVSVDVATGILYGIGGPPTTFESECACFRNGTCLQLGWTSEAKCPVLVYSTYSMVYDALNWIAFIFLMIWTLIEWITLKIVVWTHLADLMFNLVDVVLSMNYTAPDL